VIGVLVAISTPNTFTASSMFIPKLEWRFFRR
jgi:hypothetical protein